MKIQVTVVVRDRRPQIRRLTELRKWCYESARGELQGVLGSLSDTRDLELAIKLAADREPRVLVALDVERAELEAALAGAGLDRGGAPDGVEVIRVAAKRRGAPWPLASGLATPRLTSTHHLVPALRKAVLRLSTAQYARVRPLTSTAELKAYFELRYRVWKQLDYLPPERDAKTRWELDFTDRTARPLGAYAGEKLVGCARLVHRLGAEDPGYLPLIERMVAESGDARLEQNLRYPHKLNHPFDLLESFRGFASYYAKLAGQRRKVTELSRVIVDPDSGLRGRGLGEVLVDSITTLALSENAYELILACREEHRGFYERCGFHALPGIRCDRFVAVDVPAIAMVRRLGA